MASLEVLKTQLFSQLPLMREIIFISIKVWPLLTWDLKTIMVHG